MFKIIITVIFSVFLSEMAYCYFDEDISRLEYQNFSRVFEDETIGERLNRLETAIFGMSQTGDIDERLQRLAKLSGSPKIRALPIPYDNKPKNKIKRVLNSALDLFDTGTVTGFTPPLYNNNFGYSEDIYKQEYNNFLNNPHGYCTYSQKYYPQPYVYNNRPLYNNANIPPVPSSYSNHYPINRRYYQRTYTPPDMLTGVHIIND